MATKLQPIYSSVCSQYIGYRCHTYINIYRSKSVADTMATKLPPILIYRSTRSVADTMATNVQPVYCAICNQYIGYKSHRHTYIDVKV